MKKRFWAVILACIIPMMCACSNLRGGGYSENPQNAEVETDSENGTKTEADVTEDKFEVTAEAYKNLPLIEIEIENNGFPTDKENYLNCSFSMTNTENDEFNLSVDMGEVGIRLRGNSTMGMAKKPFRIKFSEKQSLFGLAKNKSWVLLADYIDQSCIRNYTAMKIANAVYDGFSPTGTHVVLVINGCYQGVYLLCEQINENKGRTGVKSDIDPDTQTEFPFLVEMDHLALSEGVSGVDNFQLEELWEPMEIKYPELDDRNLAEESDEDVVFNYIKEYMWAVLYTLKYGGSVTVSFREEEVSFLDLVDEDSYLTYVLINEIMGNRDNVWKSIYFYKTADGKLKFGPIWDFDWSVSGGDWTGLPYTEMPNKYAKSFTLITNSNAMHSGYLLNEERYNKLVAKFNSIKQSVIDIVMDLPNYYTKIETAVKIDSNYWYGENGAYMFESQFASVRLYILDKINFLEQEFSKSFTEFKSQ